MLSRTMSRGGAIARIGVVLSLTAALFAFGSSCAFASEARVNVRIEGVTHTIYSGTVGLGAATVVDSDGASHVESSTCISVLDAAAQLGAFPYVLKNTAYGLQNTDVAGDANAGLDGWSYRINNLDPWTAGTATDPKAGDSVVWYYGAWDAPLLVANQSAGYVAAGSTATVVAGQLDSGGAKSQCASASVHVGSLVATSAADGAADFHMTVPGDYGVRVDKDGCIRSAVQVMHVRYPTSFTAWKASKSVVKRTGRVTLSGKLSGAGAVPVGRIVVVKSRKRGSNTWVVVARVRTNAQGGFAISVKPRASKYYAASFVDDSTFASAATASKLVTVR